MHVQIFRGNRDHPSEKYLSAHDQAEIVAKIRTTSSVRPAYIHSFGMTKNYFIIAEHPFGVNIPKAVVANALQTPTYRFIDMDPQGTVFFRVIDRRTGEAIVLKCFFSLTRLSTAKGKKPRKSTTLTKLS